MPQNQVPFEYYCYIILNLQFYIACLSGNTVIIVNYRNLINWLLNDNLCLYKNSGLGRNLEKKSYTFNIVSAKVFRTRVVFTPRRWTFHERVNTDEHRACDNVRDRPKNFYSNNNRACMVRCCMPQIS